MKPSLWSHWLLNPAHRSSTGSIKPFWGDWSRFFRVSFQDYLTQTLFEPLEMVDTSFVMDAEKRSRFQPLWINSEHLKGYTYLLNELTYSPTSHALRW